jgi:hypothetical protein
VDWLLLYTQEGVKLLQFMEDLVEAINLKSTNFGKIKQHSNFVEALKSNFYQSFNDLP